MGKKDGFYLYFDWEQPFDRLNDADLGKIVRAMMKYVKHGEEPPNDFEGGAAFVADFVFPQIKRSIQYAENGAKGGNKTAKKQEPKPLVEPTVEPTVEALNININQNINQDINNTPKAPKGADVIRERFDRFWEAYPKKSGKGDARKVFEKLKPSADLTERMIAAISAQKRTDQWTRDRGQYIPNPATWLRQERWEDECAAAAAPVVKDISYDEFFELCK